MADLQKTVSIIFSADASDAQKKVDDLSKSLEGAGGGATSGISGVSEAIDKVGTSAKLTDDQARKLGDGLKKLAEDAGVPKEALTSIDNVLTRIGGGATGSAVIAAAAMAAIGIAAISAGRETFDFSTKVENLTGSSDKAKDALGFVRDALKTLEISLGDGLDLYSKYLQKLEGTGIAAKVAEDAFIGIVEAVKGQGGSFEDTQKALEGFIKAAGDGKIDLKELEDKIADIPGGLRIFAEALGVPIEDLKKLAENGQLGREAIELFAEALAGQKYESLTPVKDAFIDLWNTLKEIGLDLGAETGFRGALWLVEKAIRGVTLAVTGSTEFIQLFGGTLANIAFTVANLDFAGFAGRQAEMIQAFTDNVESARNKFLGLDDDLKAPGAREGATNYKELADGLVVAGDAAEQTGKKSSSLADANRAAAIEAKALSDAANLAEKSLHNQAMEAQKAQEATNRLSVEMEKIASNERIKVLEFKFKLDLAQIESDTKKAEAIFKGLDNTITSTGKTVVDLFGMFKDFDNLSYSAIRRVDDQIELENKRRQEALNLQKELAQAQIAQIKAQTRNIEKGDPLIRISGDGLKPHLEAFMWEILRTIQVRVNQDGLKMLLGA